MIGGCWEEEEEVAFVYFAGHVTRFQPISWPHRFCWYVVASTCVSVIQVLNFVRVAVQSHKVNLVSMDRNVGDDLLLYELPVDSKLQEFTISISGENPHISILDPQGRPNQLRNLLV